MLLLWEIYYSFFKIGLISFGGGYAMLPLMRQEFIGGDWLSLCEFLDILAVAEMTPGPVSINMSTFVGFQMAGCLGAAIATIGVLSPSVLLLLLIFFLSKWFTGSTWTRAAMRGIRPAVIALIALAAIFIGEQVLNEITALFIFLVCLALSLKTCLNPIFIVLIAASFSIFINIL